MRDNICEWNLLFTLCSLIQNVEARWEMSLASIKPIVLLGCWCFVNGFYAVHAVLRLGPFHWVSRIWGILLLHSSSIFFNLPHPTLPSFFTPAPGDPSQIKAGEVNKSKPCQTHWLTHQKLPWLRYTLCLPSLPTNLARSEGSPIIHASQSVLNQPLIKREHVERCRAKQPPTPAPSWFVCFLLFVLCPHQTTYSLLFCVGPLIPFTSTNGNYKSDVSVFF